MRVLVKDSVNSKLTLLDVDGVSTCKHINVKTVDGFRTYKYPSVLVFDVPGSTQKVHIVMSEEQCALQMNKLLVQDYVDLTEYAENTFITLREDDDVNLRKGASEIYWVPINS